MNSAAMQRAQQVCGAHGTVVLICGGEGGGCWKACLICSLLMALQPPSQPQPERQDAMCCAGGEAC